MSLKLVASVTAPTLVLDSEGTSGPLTGWAGDIVTRCPTARIAAWQVSGTVPDETLAPVLTEFFQHCLTTRVTEHAGSKKCHMSGGAQAPASRYSEGVQPASRRNSLVRWLWSA